MGGWLLHLGDCLEVLRTLPENSVDACVTDPPAGISFMGKSWDSDKGGRDEWIKWLSEIFTEVHRVLKPGAHGLVWAIPRTSHWTATALENSGFQVRDVIVHLFGSGFPKSLDVSKAIDKAAGARREDLGPHPTIQGKGSQAWMHEARTKGEASGARLSAPSTDAAKQWEGWGTSLKPASEHWILIKKPISERTIALNVQRWGTGAINVDASRIGTEQVRSSGEVSDAWRQSEGRTDRQKPNPTINTGRFPSNVLLDDRAAELLDEQTGELASRGQYLNRTERYEVDGSTYKFGGNLDNTYANQKGGASRFFMRFQYCAKSSQSERNAGLEGMPEKSKILIGAEGHKINPTTGRPVVDIPRANIHPTVKPIKLMEYLCRLITPPGGKILDPFMGSGTTGIAAKRLGFDFIGIELNPEYFEIALRRIENAKPDEVAPDPQLTIAEATHA